MCQHGGQGVNDCGNDIYMWYCSIREHDLVRRFVDLTYVKVHVTVYIYIVCFRVVAADALCLLAMDTRVYAAVSRSLLFIHDIRKIMKYKMFDERMVWLGAKSATGHLVNLSFQRCNL